MSATSIAPRRRWVRFLFWAAAALLLLALVLAGAAYYGVRYLASEEIKRFEDVIGLNGGDVAFRSFKVRGWGTYPEVEVTLTDLVVEERNDRNAAPLLTVDTVRVPLHVDLWEGRRATLRGFFLRGGGFHVRKDSAGRTNLGRLLGTDGGGGGSPIEGVGAHAAAEDSYLRLDPNAAFVVKDFDVSYAAARKATAVAGRLRRLRVDSFRRAPHFAAAVDLNVRMRELTLNSRDGGYLDGADVTGVMHVAVAERVLTGRAEAMRFGPNAIDVDARFYLDRDATSVIRLAMPESHVDSARQILAPGIRRAIDPFDVEGAFSSVTEIASTFAPGDEAVVTIDLALRGNTAVVNGERFGDTYLDARFVNVAADTSGGRRGSQLFVDTVRTDYFGFDMRAADAVIEADVGESPRLVAEGELRGPASAVSRAVAGRDFVFTRGRVLAKAATDGPADDIVALMAGATFEAAITDAAVYVPAAGVTLPLRRLDLRKGLDTTTFELAGSLPGMDRDYRMAGHLRGIGRLLGTAPAAEVETYVDFSAEALTWRGVVNLLGGGEAGGGSALDPVVPELAPGADTMSTAAAPARKSSEEKKSAFKSTLRLVERTFRPSLDVAVDTLRYYGLEVTDFRTGMHFEADDEIVLERTSFRIDTGAVGFDARAGIGPERRTPFSVSLAAEHLDLDAVAREVDYFGLGLLRDLRTLPDDVDLVIEQRGLLDVVDGIVTDQADGRIDLRSNGDLPFSAQVDFEPDVPGVDDVQTTRVALQGSPELFNTFFQTEDFFFRGGDFDFRMGYAGLVPSLRDLIDENRMQLRVEDAVVDYRSAGIRVPFEHLEVEMVRDTAAVDLRIEDARFGQEVTITGHANNLSEIVLGESGKPFSSDVTVRSPRLVWRDINRLISKLGEAEDTTAVSGRGPGVAEAAFAKTAPASTTPPRAVYTPADAAPADTQLHLRRTLKEVFTRFRPRATIEIGELQLTNAFAVRDVNSTVSLGTDDVLYVDTTGFDYRDGYLDLAGRLDLSDLSLTPFRAVLNSDRLEVASLLEGLEYLDVPELADAEQLDGELSLRLDVSGAVTGGDDVAGMLTEATCGTLDLQLRDLVLAGVAPIDDLAAKIKMRKRMDVLRFAPIDVHLRLDGNEAYLPLTALQANAFDAYAQGVIRADSVSSVLVSLPLVPNLRRDLDIVPERAGLDGRRLRVHLELTDGGEGGALETKLRLRRGGWLRRVGIEEE